MSLAAIWRRPSAHTTSAHSGSAIVATWVAVAFDLIAKIRQLAATGDDGANDFIRTLDQAIEGDSPNRQLTIERNLLVVAHETFEFIEHRERKELERLRDDRHVCAHPAFVRPGDVFRPATGTGPGAHRHGR